MDYKNYLRKVFQVERMGLAQNLVYMTINLTSCGVNLDDTSERVNSSYGSVNGRTS